MAVTHTPESRQRFLGRLLLLGLGTIGRATLPLLLRHLEIGTDCILIVDADSSSREVADRYGVAFMHARIDHQNYEEMLGPLIDRGDFLLNLTIEIQSTALIQLCRARDALYLDTCIEPWAGGYTSASIEPALRTCYALRESALALRAPERAGPTAVVTHGANPGLVSHFVKRALLRLGDDEGLHARPCTSAEWAELAHRLGVKVIHIAERDSQYSLVPKRRGEFVNTWSIEGFVGEAMQPAELGWGTHEKYFPSDGSPLPFGCGSSIYLQQPGALTRVRSWTPLEGAYLGFLTAHAEASSIADCLTLRVEDKVIYRPTVHYAYHPCDAAVLSLHELTGRNWLLQDCSRVMMDELVDGEDELGVLLMGHRGDAYWYGSRLSLREARRLAPNNNATSLQVAASVLAGVVWAVRNPRAGVVEPDDIDWVEILPTCMPYLGKVFGVYTDWNPIREAFNLFRQDLDQEDPWQFKNFRIS